MSHIIRKLAFPVAIFLSALLLFTIQPLAAKAILPCFGGTPSTWGATLVFFQLQLLAGYYWSHLIISSDQPGLTRNLQLFLIIAVGTLVIFQSGQQVECQSSLGSASEVLTALWSRWGIAVFLLCSTSPFIQGIAGRQSNKTSVYKLYALSNLASLIGLLIVPLALEPAFELEAVLNWWRTLFVLFCFILALSVFLDARYLPSKRQEEAKEKLIELNWSWFVLPALTSMLLLAITAHCTHDIAAVPLFWVLPLALYLLSWIITFSELFNYRRLPLLALLSASLATQFFVQFSSFALLLALNLAILFVASLVCHAELARRKPHSKFLTSFYLMTAAGSCFGSAFITFIAPLIFDSQIDYRLTLFYLVCIIVLIKLCEDGILSNKRAVKASLFIFLLALPLVKLYEKGLSAGKLVDRKRNFYGVVEVTDNQQSGRLVRTMNSGTTIHGTESLLANEAGLPFSYYSPEGAAGRVLSQTYSDGPRKLGFIGLGGGSLAYYVREKDEAVFFEINPAVVQMARRHFTFLDNAKSKPEINVGDARLELRRHQSYQFDILVVDAFSGDAIPMHLITLEAMKLYLSHLKPDGVLIYHISNRFLSLGKVLNSQANALGLRGMEIDSRGSNESKLILPSQYYVIANTTNYDAIRSDAKSHPSFDIKEVDDFPSVRVWTDSYSNILDALR